MQIKFDIDVTPEEARAFLGLPDVQPLQQAMMAELEQRLRDALAAMEPEALMKAWLPAGLEGWDQMQRAFWSQFGSRGNRGS